MVLNAKKTKLTVFTLQLDVKLNMPVMIAGEEIEQEKSCKLLGVVLDSHMKFDEHVKSATGKTRSPVHGLLTLK